MKLCFIPLLLLSNLTSFSQSETIYFKSLHSSKTTTEKKAKFRLEIEENDSTKREIIYVHSTNQILSIKSYNNGLPVGLWQEFQKDGTFSRSRNFDALEFISEEETKKIITQNKLLGDSLASLPVFRNGESAMITHISEKIEYPEECIDDRIQGTVFAVFTIEKSGQLSSIRIQGEDTNRFIAFETRRLIQSMQGKWMPATTKNNRFVPYIYILPIEFRIR